MITKVFVIDDSLLVRNKIISIISKYDNIKVIGSANNPIDALEIFKNVGLPDIFILDIEMPKMNGIEFLKKIELERPTPVIIVSNITKEKKDKIGFVNKNVKFISKKEFNNQLKFEKTLLEYIKTLSEKKRLNTPSNKIIAIGSSTGGTQTLEKIVSKLKYGHKGIVIVQHMPKSFTSKFATRLNSLTDSRVVEALDGDLIEDSKIIIAKGGYHLEVFHSPKGFRVRLKDGEKVNSHKPSVNVLFKSVAHQIGKNSMGIILTGMGDDGAEGLLEMRKSGAITYSENEKDCIVYGMPKVAYEIGASMQQLSINEIIDKINNF